MKRFVLATLACALGLAACSGIDNSGRYSGASVLPFGSSAVFRRAEPTHRLGAAASGAYPIIAVVIATYSGSAGGGGGECGTGPVADGIHADDRTGTGSQGAGAGAPVPCPAGYSASATCVAVEAGPPKSGQNCAGSPDAVDDSFVNQNGRLVNITDINSVWDLGKEVGWLYRGSDGWIYVQANYSSSVGVNWAVGLGLFGIVSGTVGGSSPGGYSGLRHLTNGGQMNGGVGVKCFSRGADLGSLA